MLITLFAFFPLPQMIDNKSKVITKNEYFDRKEEEEETVLILSLFPPKARNKNQLQRSQLVFRSKLVITLCKLDKQII